MKPTTTQQTGKQFKGVIVLSMLGIFIGTLWAASAISTDGDSSTALAITGFSFAGLVGAKFLAWWNHG